MEDCAKLFSAVTGVKLSRRHTDYRSADEIDKTLFDVVVWLFFEKRDDFYFLKHRFEIGVRQKDDRLLLSAAGYFYYVDCEFKKAIQCFKRAIAVDPTDLEPWFCLAFCYRQTGQEERFDSFMLNYDRIIDAFRKKKGDIDTLVLKHARSKKYVSSAAAQWR